MDGIPNKTPVGAAGLLLLGLSPVFEQRYYQEVTMPHDPDLFGKTFDQQLEVAGDTIADRDISPNRRIPGEIVFEPLLNGVRVTARDEDHKVLWGFIGSKGMIKQIHCPIAVYETLQALLSEELEKHGLPTSEEVDPIQAAKQALSGLQDTIDKLGGAITVKNVSKATIERAKAIGRVVNDANRMICLETSSFKGVTGENEQAPVGRVRRPDIPR
ncbi:MAG: hypothetical protein KAV82_01695 [Phycisphaerae bacterium]|nr:hypothetical protein [Phycisphaerae bacterium]